MRTTVSIAVGGTGRAFCHAASGTRLLNTYTLRAEYARGRIGDVAAVEHNCSACRKQRRRKARDQESAHCRSSRVSRRILTRKEAFRKRRETLRDNPAASLPALPPPDCYRDPQ